MKKSRLFIISMLSLMAATHSHAAQFVVSSVGQSQAMLGTGYRVDEESWAEECVKGTVSYEGRQDSNLSFSSKISQSLLAKELGFEAGMKASWGAATVTAAASFLNTSKESSHSIVAVYKGDYTMKNAYLKDVIDNHAKFNGNKKLKPDCGEAYVKGIGRGAKLFFSIRIDFVSEEQKRKFAAAASYSSSAFSVKGSIHNSKETFDTRTKVTVQAYQLGGDVRQLSHIFGPRTQVKETSEPRPALAIVDCTFGNFERCDEALDNALRYAQDEFPEQLKTNPDDPDLGPANLYYILQPYEGHSPAVDAALRMNRKVLEDTLFAQTAILGLAHNATINRVYPLAVDQAAEAEQILEDVMSNISILKGLADECYNYIGTCDTNAKLAKESIKKIVNDKVFFPPKSFLQFCGIGYYIAPEVNRDLSETIHTILAVAEKLNPAIFDKKTNQGLNKCEAAYETLKKQDTFDVSILRNQMGASSTSHRIYTLDPFVDMGHFKKVDLSNQRLVSTKNLSYFKLAKKIDLSGNQIRELTDLSAMENVEDLSLAGNRLRDLTPMGSPLMLARLDVRNNIIDLDCPKIETLRVCIKKSYAGKVGASIVGSDLPRSMIHPAVVKLLDGRIYVSSGKDSILYDPIQHTKVIGPNLNRARRGHTATLLEDGRVLIVGGMDAGTSVEIFDPINNIHQTVTESAPSRISHSAIKLRDGRVLISGGYEVRDGYFAYRPTQTLSIFDPSTNEFKSVGNMVLARASHTMSQLPDGKVLIVGGYSKQGGHRMTELWDPTTGLSKTFVPINEGRYGHTATLLDDGRVLIAGGLEEEGHALGSLEYFDASENVFKFSFESMKQPRAFHTATMIESGQVIFAGGSNTHYELLNYDQIKPDTCCTDQIEVYTPNEESFTNLGRIQLTYSRALHQAVIAQPGMIFIFGGSDLHSAKTIELISYGGIEPDLVP